MSLLKLDITSDQNLVYILYGFGFVYLIYLSYITNGLRKESTDDLEKEKLVFKINSLQVDLKNETERNQEARHSLLEKHQLQLSIEQGKTLSIDLFSLNYRALSQQYL